MGADFPSMPECHGTLAELFELLEYTSGLLNILYNKTLNVQSECKIYGQIFDNNIQNMRSKATLRLPFQKS